MDSSTDGKLILVKESRFTIPYFEDSVDGPSSAHHAEINFANLSPIYMDEIASIPIGLIGVGGTEADILALKHISRIFGHYNKPALPFYPVCGCGPSSAPPVHCSNTDLKMRNKKCWVIAMSENSTDML